MKFSINQSELQNALAVVLKGIATRSTLPILSGIYLDAKNDSLTLQATDLELSIQYTVPALVENEGRAVVPGKLFSEIVKNLPDAAVHVEAEKRLRSHHMRHRVILHQDARRRRLPRVSPCGRAAGDSHPLFAVRLYGEARCARGVEG